MTKTVSFDISPRDSAVARKIADRALAVAAKFDPDTPRHQRRSHSDFWMDIVAVHTNGNPLRLEDMLAADDFNFAHDVFGIERHLDRDTGELTGFFSPRFSARETAVSA